MLGRAPTALVLCGGGARGAYQVGVLQGIAEICSHDFNFEIITGVSAGGINAASMAGHRGNLAEASNNLAAAWQRLSINQVFSTRFGKLSWSVLRWLWMVATGRCSVHARGLLDTRPLGRFLTRALNFEGVSHNLAQGRLRALALSTTCYRTGHTVTFVQGQPKILAWKRARRRAELGPIGVAHVMASAALPLLFPAIRVGAGFYGDGSIRQTSPLAPAIHLGARRILAISVRYPTTAKPAAEPALQHPPPAQVLGMMMHSMFLDALENDAERLQRINRTLSALPAHVQTPDRLQRMQLLVLRPSRDLGGLAKGMERHLPRTLRLITRGLGSTRSPSDFLSYLMFEPTYLQRLIDLGKADALRQRERIRRFLQGRVSDTGTARFRRPDFKLPHTGPLQADEKTT